MSSGPAREDSGGGPTIQHLGGGRVRMRGFSRKSRVVGGCVVLLFFAGAFALAATAPNSSDAVAATALLVGLNFVVILASTAMRRRRYGPPGNRDAGPTAGQRDVARDDNE